MTRQTDTLTREAADALTATSTADLLTKAYALTHRIQSAERAEFDSASEPGRERHRRTQEVSRAARDLITAEVIRRTEQTQ